jgi:N-acetylmuramic acid 6-phosphate etherase
VTEQALVSELERLVSEARNPSTMQIDLLPTASILKAMNEEDKQVPLAVEAVIPSIAAAVDRVVHAFRHGGRLIYMGAGTSGRLGILDASECPPTFSVPEGMVVGLIAGGIPALTRAVEGAEDDSEQGIADLAAIGLTAEDVVAGIAVSGRTPYVVGGLSFAKTRGATTIAIACNADSAIARIADFAIVPIVGPEVLTGSTRLKSGTAQKLVLNMLTTASMIRLGKSYENLMVDLTASNRKLLARAALIVMAAIGCSLEEAQAHLARSDDDVKLAILIARTGLDKEAARSALARADGFLRRAIAETRGESAP